jgi:hypothetical protein
MVKNSLTFVFLLIQSLLTQNGFAASAVKEDS